MVESTSPASESNPQPKLEPQFFCEFKLAVAAWKSGKGDIIEVAIPFLDEEKPAAIGYVVGGTERQALLCWAESRKPQLRRMTRAEIHDKAIADLTGETDAEQAA